MNSSKLIFVVLCIAGISTAGKASDRIGITNDIQISIYSSMDNIDQDRIEVGFDNMMTELTRVHKAVYSLPYEYEYIKNTLMVEVEAKKLEIAPHFPNRSSYGDNTTLGHQLFKEWYLSYPSECSAYIAFLDQFILAHSN